MIITRQRIHIFCKVCEGRLHLSEEWATGLCTRHADPNAAFVPHPREIDWNAILEAIDASDPRKPAPPRTMKRD